MRKTTIIMFLIMQIVLLFFFENIHSFMNVLQEKEAGIKKEQLITKARYSVLKNGSDIKAVKKESGFEFAAIVRSFRKEPVEEMIGNERYYIFDVRSEAGSILRFRERLDTPFSITLNKLKGFISAFIILIGIFIIITGIYLVVRFKKGKSVEEPSGLPILQDYITKLKESETTLKGIVDEQKINVQKSEEIGKKVVNRINAAIILLNENGRVELFNPSAEKMFSKSSAFVLNNTSSEVFSRFPEIISFIESKGAGPVSESVASGSSIFLIELLPVTPAGKLLIIRDVTEEKKREEMLNNRKNFMMLGEMATFLTHEIRNSLGVIYGYTKTLKSDSEKTKKINSEIIFLTEMMENFLSFSKPLNKTKNEKVDTAQMIKSICDENNISSEIRGNSGRFIKCDTSMIRSVFSNLILNAKEAGAKKIEINFRKKDKKLINIEIKDDGTGIKSSNLDKVWYPFFTLKPKGTGMGLAIVKKMVNFLNGEINILDSGKGGTTFGLTFYSPDDETDN
ncbi:MAG: ATP-binding protein [Acidobacteriota bacterium]